LVVVRAFVEYLRGKMTPAAFQRMYSMLSGFRPKLDFPAIGIAGGGTDTSLACVDGEVYRALLLLSTVIPGALVQKGPCRFFTASKPLLWKLAAMLNAPPQVGDLTVSVSQDMPVPTAPSAWEGVRITDRRNRIPMHHQTEGIGRMIGKAVSFVYATVGMGKSYMVLRHMLHLAEHACLPEYVVVAVPRAALTAVHQEICFFFPPERVVLLCPLRKTKRALGHQLGSVSDLRPGTVVVIEHDHLRRTDPKTGVCVTDALCALPSLYAWIDEVHKAVDRTSQRTRYCRQLTSAAQFTTVTTGTPVLNDNIMSLQPWLQDVCGFPVTRANIVVAMSLMNAHVVNTGIVVRETSVDVPSVATLPEYRALAPPALGGTNRAFSPKFDMNALLAVSWATEDITLVAETIRRMATSVFLVARDATHQIRLRSLLQEGLQLAATRATETGDHARGQGLAHATVEIMTGSIQRDAAQPWHCVIGRMNLSVGFSMCFAKSMGSGIGKTNQATREQLRGLINRASQTHKEIEYFTVHSRLTSLMRTRQMFAATLAELVKELADDIVLPQT
jgi:hypothetical protein